MGMMCYFCMKETVEGGRCTCCGRTASPQTNAGAQSALAPGTRLDNGNIIVGNILGQGGFGITYIARDSTCGLIALKEFYPRDIVERRGAAVSVLGDRKADYARNMRDFKREVKHLLNLKDHPHIVTVLFDLDENNTYYYGMELLQGESLRAYIQRNGRLDPRDALHLLDPICDALSYAHQRKTIHRDIAPDNIFLRKNPQNPGQPSPCLIDFGAAFTDKNGFTLVAPSVKKNGYSPPDQGLPYNQQGPFIDVYALAATYYTMVTGCTPPPSTERNFIPLRAPSSLNPSVSRNLDEVIFRGMELNHENRYQSVDAIWRDLHKLLDVAQRKSPHADPQMQCSKGAMKGNSYVLSDKRMSIGREGMLRIVDSDRLASRKHCEIFEENGRWYLVDMRSHNGTWVNRELLQPYVPVQLSTGDRIVIGYEEFVFILK